MPIWVSTVCFFVVGVLAMAETSYFVNRGRRRTRADYSALGLCWLSVLVPTAFLVMAS